MAISQALGFGGFIEARIQPGGFITFHYEGAGGAAEGIGMDLEEAVLVLYENEIEGIKHFVRAEPDVLCLTPLYTGLELLLECLARDAVDSVGGYKQVVLWEVGEGVYLGLELYFDAQFDTSLL